MCIYAIKDNDEPATGDVLAAFLSTIKEIVKERV